MVPFGQTIHPPCLLLALPVLSMAMSDSTIPWTHGSGFSFLSLCSTPILSRAGAESWNMPAEVSPSSLSSKSTQSSYKLLGPKREAFEHMNAEAPQT